ncbi:hypothetical protein E4N62_06215 [Streptomyces sp. MNU76]|uniref:hypothetical protein n=1 Tax=Streptomyces sp. MNU76 TaxID=2560026 RepID=UPI001E61EE4B|nr:hypothetical protein [Streptomyces sp. MNU76]MCC9704883.1 hypothetical protein [Streptomyces sp. MNU76]
MVCALIRYLADMPRCARESAIPAHLALTTIENREASGVVPPGDEPLFRAYFTEAAALADRRVV